MCIFYKVGPDEVSESCDYIWVVHWYEIGNYEGHGEAVSWDGKNYRLHSLSHCSCYGPEDGLASGDIFSLDDIFGDTIRLGFDIKPEIMEKLRELIQPIMADELQPTETGSIVPTHSLDRNDVCARIGQFFLYSNNGDYEKTATQILGLLLKDISISGPDSICIELARPGLLIGMRGKTVIELQEYLGLKILVKESESINSLVIPVDYYALYDLF